MALALGAAACKGKGKSAPATGAAGPASPNDAGAVTGVPASDAAPAAAPPTDAASAAPAGPTTAARSLRGQVPLTFAVSSLVKNPSKSPHDLIDGSLATAWNSRTGDLVGAWLAVRVPAAAHVAALRMTIGATAPATAAGDPFTMNHRISRVRVTRDGALVREVDLDPEVRAPQDLPIDGPGGDYKIEVLATIAGSKPTWREVCVSELDVLGTAPATPGEHPAVVAIGSLDTEPVGEDALALHALAPVASLGEVCAASGVSAAECGNMKYEPAYPTLAPPSLTPPPGWSQATLIGAGAGGPDCQLVIGVGDTLFASKVGGNCAAPVVDPHASALVDAIPGGDLELLVRLRHDVPRDPNALPPVRGRAPDLSYETVRVCGVTAAGLPGCTDALVVAGISEAPEDDDPEPVATTTWSLGVSVAAGALTVRPGKGEYHYDGPEPAEVGRYRVRL